MKFCIVCNPLDNKMREDTYSFVYRGMYDALCSEFNPQIVTESCSAQDIDADTILFWDVNSCHHIEIEDVSKHPAIKLEYMSDPFQEDVKGVYRRYDMYVHKLGAKQRLRRALDRGVEKIICPTKVGFLQYFGPHLGETLTERMLLFFPPAPWFSLGTALIKDRKHGGKILANGACGDTQGAYDFRAEVYKYPEVTYIPHWINNKQTPMGKQYGEFLRQWGAGLALCDLYPVVKYYEMPMAGCLTFMQQHSDLNELGFKHYDSCIFIDRHNAKDVIRDFLNKPELYQDIATKGTEIMRSNYTADHFAKFVRNWRGAV